MDKRLSKEVLSYHDVPVTKTYELKGNPYDELPVPCVVKPNANGSSIGVAIVEAQEELVSAIDKALIYGDILVEEKITGREFSVGVLDGQALPIIELIPKVGFYDYENKYQADATEEICPANLNDEKTREMQTLALKAHKALRLGAYSRIDFLMNEEGKLFCIEANTLPGMTPTSLLPQEAAEIGLSFEALCEKIVSLALG